jgi:hypothetical protein
MGDGCPDGCADPRTDRRPRTNPNTHQHARTVITSSGFEVSETFVVHCITVVTWTVTHDGISSSISAARIVNTDVEAQGQRPWPPHLEMAGGCVRITLGALEISLARCYLALVGLQSP